jgi:hypothetical protein
MKLQAAMENNLQKRRRRCMEASSLNRHFVTAYYQMNAQVVESTGGQVIGDHGSNIKGHGTTLELHISRAILGSGDMIPGDRPIGNHSLSE